MNEKDKKFRNAPEVVNDARKRFANIKKIKSEELLIWGGEVTDGKNQFERFLGFWAAGKKYFNWGLWETVSRFDLVQFDDKTPLQPPTKEDTFEHIERVRLFGETGDLFIRRDGHRLIWRFIGDAPADKWPQLPEISDFASAHDGEYFFHDVDYMLWRDYENDAIKNPEQRVSTLWAKSPHVKLASGPKYLRQRHYLRQGRVEFVRYLTIGEKSNG